MEQGRAQREKESKNSVNEEELQEKSKQETINIIMEQHKGNILIAVSRRDVHASKHCMSPHCMNPRRRHQCSTEQNCIQVQIAETKVVIGLFIMAVSVIAVHLCIVLVDVHIYQARTE